ncbi:MAG: hypothetical protein ACYDCK_07790 [Thermoplasmatota archaeon]
MVSRVTLRELFVVASVLALAAPVALAHQGDGRPHMQPFQEIRIDKVSVDAFSMTHELERVSEPLTDYIRYTFDAPSATATFQYRPDAPDASRGLTMSVTFLDAVAYRDTNGNGLYDAGVDPADERATFGTANWSFAAPLVLYAGNDPGNLTSASTRLGNSTFTLEAYANGRQDVVAQTGMHPQDVKMNWKIKGWPFQFPDSRLAFHVQLAWSSDLDERVVLGAEGTPNATVFLRSDVLGFLGWAEQAREGDAAEQQIPTLETISVSLGPTFDAGGGMTAQAVEFDYPGAGNIIHDPTFGIEYAPVARPALLGIPPSALIGGAAILAVGIGAFVLWRTWKRAES